MMNKIKTTMKFALVTLGVAVFVTDAWAEEDALDKRMKYVYPADLAAYKETVRSITNLQNGELYSIDWSTNADYRLDQMLTNNCKGEILMLLEGITNASVVLNNAPFPGVAGLNLPPFACCSFAAKNAEGQHVVGRNFDYDLPMAHVLLRVPRDEKKGRYASVGTVDAGWLKYDVGQLDPSKGTNDLSYVAMFPYICMDGMNEKGFMVSILSVDKRKDLITGQETWLSEQHDANRTNITATLAIRYLLDRADSTEAAVNMLTNFNFYAGTGMPDKSGKLNEYESNYHYFLCDKSGDSRVVEWLPPSKKGDSWKVVVTNVKEVTNFYLTDKYNSGDTNRWDILRHALAQQEGQLEECDAMNLCRAVTQRLSPGSTETNRTHWSVVYNLNTCSANIATLGNFDEIFPYRLAGTNWVDKSTTARPTVRTDLPTFDADTAEPGKVYQLKGPISGTSNPSSFAGTPVAAVNRMGFTYDAPDETLHIVATNEVTNTCRAVFYVVMSTGDVSQAACSIVAGINDWGLAGRIVKFKNSTSAGSVSPSGLLMDVLNNCETWDAVIERIDCATQSVGGCGLILSDAMGNMKIWGPDDAKLESDEASKLVKYSLDFRDRIYEIDGIGRGEFDELPGLLRLASSSNTQAIVSMGYGHLDVMLPESNLVWRVAVPNAENLAYGVINEPKKVANTTATITRKSDGTDIPINSYGQLVAKTNELLKVTYKAEKDYCFSNGSLVWEQTFDAYKLVTTAPAPGAAPFRTPDYAEITGRDWLFNHAIAGKECPDEAAADNGVDLFYVYPTLNNSTNMSVVGGFRDIDDAMMRSNVTATLETAVGNYYDTGRCFADMTHVYAPYYRQATIATAHDCATNALGKTVTNACANFLQRLYEGPAYADITNALDVYFAKWNNGRPLVLAAHSQGSAMLRLVMEHYFTRLENRDRAKQIICSYQLGFSIGQSSMSNITATTGIQFASDATGTNVIVSYNTVGEGATGNSLLLSPDSLSINPLTWTRGTNRADRTLNLGARTNELVRPEIIIPHLYGAQVVDGGTNRGEVVVCKELNGKVLPPNIMGTNSLHGHDYAAFQEDLHKNCFDRITAATGRKPVVGKPTDYSASTNWMSRPVTSDKPLDVFYLYPTCVPGTCKSLIGEIEDGMKAAANGHYKRGPSTFESYANIYAPYYRQGSAIALVSDLTPDGIQSFGSRHVVKTDVFAALDYYFTNRNPGAARPFILASHSQGSANMKNVLEEYFVGAKASYTNQLVAAYILGYKITPDWCAKVGIPFANGETDTGVVLTWNAEGPGDKSDNFLTADPNQLAINPINWTTNTTEARKEVNLGSVITNSQGVLYNTGKPGVTGARLQTNRPGAVIVDAPEAIPVGISPGFGTKSYHFEDWGFFHDSIGANGFARYVAFADLKPVVPGEEMPTYGTPEEASAAAEKAYVKRPNTNVEQVVTAPDYNALFAVSAVRQGGSSSSWTLAIDLTQAASNGVQTALAAAMPSLVATVTNEMPTATVSTQAGLYYGMAGETNVTEIGAAAVPDGRWILGDGSEKVIQGEQPEGVTDRAFYILKAAVLPNE